MTNVSQVCSSEVSLDIFVSSIYLVIVSNILISGYYSVSIRFYFGFEFKVSNSFLLTVPSFP